MNEKNRLLKNNFLKQLEKFNKNIDIHIKESGDKLWNTALNNLNPQPVQGKPTLTLLGGQPGAGKSFSTEKILESINGNGIVINGDDFRKDHKYFNKIYDTFGEDASKHTGVFAGKAVEFVRNKAIENNYNIIIEGTFRNPETPVKELNRFSEIGYECNIVISTCNKDLSWQSTIDRAKTMETRGQQPRFVPKEVHDEAVKNLAFSAENAWNTGKVQNLKVYNREGLIFDSDTMEISKLKETINNEINGLTQSNITISNEQELEEKSTELKAEEGGLEM